jgi:SSS family solute:Na+ symporter
MDRMGFVFLFCIAGMWALGGGEDKKSFSSETSDFSVSGGFLAGSLLILGILTGLYGYFW